MAQRAIRTTLPDGRTALNNIIDKYTGESIQLVKIDSLPVGVTADGIIYFETSTSTHGTEYWTRTLINGFVKVSWFGAVGDGTTDDTTAILTALTGYSKCLFDTGLTYNTSQQLGIVRDDIEWRGNGATIKLTAESAAAVDIAGSGIKIQELNINANNNAQRGLYIRGDNIEVRNCRIYSSLGRTSSGSGIRVGNREGLPLSNIVIKDNHIHSINAPLDGSNGAGYGSARGIQIDSTEPINDQGVFITNNRVENIIAREGDGIQLLINGGGSAYEKFPSIISGNYIKNCTRRYIKVQASNISVSDNICENTLSDEELPNANNAIGAIQGQNINIYNNKVDATLYEYGISVNGNVDAPTPLINVYNNEIKSGANSTSDWSKGTYQRAIRVQDATQVSVIANSITGNGKIQFANTTNSVISSNTVSASPGDNLATGVIDIDSGSTGIQITNNIGVGDTTSSPSMFINMMGSDCSIIGNKADYGDTNYSLIRFDTTSFRNTVSENTITTKSFNLVSGPGQSQNYVLFNNRGGTVNGSAKSIYYLQSPPTSGNWNTGDIIIRQYNPSSSALSRTLGWVCQTGTTSNDGGVWVPFGLTNVFATTQIPEGNITAPTGALFFRTPSVATPDTALYVKTTDGGNTGWKSLTVKAEAQSDSTADTIEELRTDFNSLLASLRAADMLKT